MCLSNDFADAKANNNSSLPSPKIFSNFEGTNYAVMAFGNR